MKDVAFCFFVVGKKERKKDEKSRHKLNLLFLAEKNMWDLSCPWQACSKFSQWLLVAFTLYVPSHNQ